MTFYLPNTDVRPTGFEPAEFIDLPDPTDRPWVHLEGADADEVARVIDTCPSGALTYTRTDGAPNSPLSVAKR